MTMAKVGTLPVGAEFVAPLSRRVGVVTRQRPERGDTPALFDHGNVYAVRADFVVVWDPEAPRHGLPKAMSVYTPVEDEEEVE